MARAKAAPVQPGDRFKQGIAARITDDGVYIGREAEAGEACPPETQELTVGGIRVFLSDHQGPIERQYLVK